MILLSQVVETKAEIEAEADPDDSNDDAGYNKPGVGDRIGDGVGDSLIERKNPFGIWYKRPSWPCSRNYRPTKSTDRSQARCAR